MLSAPGKCILSLHPGEEDDTGTQGGLFLSPSLTTTHTHATLIAPTIQMS